MSGSRRYILCEHEYPTFLAMTACSEAQCMPGTHTLAFMLSTVGPKFSKLGLVPLASASHRDHLLLSYASLLGIASTTLLVVAILIDGLSKFDAPGSL